MSDSNLAELSFLEEVTWGTIPSIALNTLRYTSESLDDNTDSAESQEVRSDRQIADQIRTGKSASGDINFELSYGSFDVLLTGFMMAAWGATKNFTATDYSIVSSNVLKSVAQDMSAFIVGEWIEVRGFTTAGNNGYHKVTAVNASASGGDEITLDATVSTALANEAVGDTVTVKGATLFNGTTKKSFVLEREYTDLTNIFDNFTGMRVDSMSLNVQTNSIITGSFSFQGEQGAATAAATIGTGANVAANSNDVMNAIDHVAELREAKTTLTDDVLSITLQGANNLRQQQAVGNLGAIGIGLGKVQLTGTLQAYFATRALLNKYRAWTSTSLSFKTEDGSGNAYIWDLEKIYITSAPAVIGGQDQDVVADMAWSAVLGGSGTSGKTFSITRIPA